jgi:PIN domain nuclease of toxin-antitoxin system
MAGDKRSLSTRYEYVDLGLSGFRKALEKARKALNDGPLVLNWWSRASEMLGGDILSIRTAHISVLAALPDIHRDPFDRMLIAQATAEALTLIACDEMFGQYPAKTLW